MQGMEQGGNRKTGDSLSMAVLDAVAAHRGIDPLELDARLVEAIDPDALDALFSRSESNSGLTQNRVIFSYHGYDVHVTHTGDVHISEPDNT